MTLRGARGPHRGGVIARDQRAPGHSKLYDSSRILNASLQPVEYEDDYRLLDPSVSAYSQAMETNIDIILDTIDADGVYWDEMDHSHVRVTYSGEDGHTVDTVRISPGSGGLSGVDITRAYSNVTLKTLAWRVQKALALLAAGKTLVANGAPETETMASVHFPRFVETPVCDLREPGRERRAAVRLHGRADPLTSLSKAPPGADSA